MFENTRRRILAFATVRENALRKVLMVAIYAVILLSNICFHASRHILIRLGPITALLTSTGKTRSAFKLWHFRLVILRQSVIVHIILR